MSVLWSFGDAVLVLGDRHECGRGAVHGRRIRSRGLIEGSACASLVALVILSEGTFFCTDGGLYHIVNSIHFLLEILSSIACTLNLHSIKYHSPCPQSLRTGAWHA